VGEARAAAIVAVRERLGRFRSVRDLLRVKGIGPKSLSRLEPLVVLDPPKDVAPRER
jgi:competence protein ComEA